MFDNFRRSFDATSRSGHEAWCPEPMKNVGGYQEFAHEFAGATFNSGLYRFYDETTAPSLYRDFVLAFPDVHRRMAPFAYDWMGNQFALDFGRRQGDEPSVVLLDFGLGTMLEIPGTFKSFHEERLVENAAAVLVAELFDEWMRTRGSGPIARDECVGYSVPMFLGGSEDLDNCDLISLEVHLNLSAQLIDKTRDLPPGTPISSVTI